MWSEKLFRPTVIRAACRCVADMKAKLLFREDDGRIIGGHVRGGEAAADMVNIVAAAVQSGLTAEQLATMQFARIRC